MEIRYSFAEDATGKMVKIDDAVRGASYRCPQCGQEMIPKLGEVNAHHFAHKSECACSGESYLHKIAKLKFKETFDRASKFVLEYRMPVRCPNHKNKQTCVFADEECNSFDPTIRKLDLKAIFDECMIEQQVDNGRFVADVLLRDSSGRTDKILMIEFYHSHKCDTEKIRSGYPIVEIRIDNEDDIITTNRIAYSEKVDVYGFKKMPCKGKEVYYAYFYDQDDASDLKVIKAQCFDIHNVNGHGRYDNRPTFAAAIDPQSYADYSENTAFRKNPPSIGEAACAIAYYCGFREFDNCAVCVNSRRSRFNEEAIWCMESRIYPELPKNPDYSEARWCHRSFPYVNRAKRLSKYLSGLKYKVVACQLPIDSENDL